MKVAGLLHTWKTKDRTLLHQNITVLAPPVRTVRASGPALPALLSAGPLQLQRPVRSSAT